MQRKHLLAAELFSYSYNNYEDHLGNIRFDKIMPNEALLWEKAEAESWPDDRIAEALKLEPNKVPEWRKRFQEARAIVDAVTPAQSFRLGVKASIEDAVEQGLGSPSEIESLLTQICYRAADLSYLLDKSEELLSDYSQELRREVNSDQPGDA